MLEVLFLFFYFILWLVEGLTSFNKDNSANFADEWKVERSVPGYLFLESTRKNFKSNLILIVILILKSIALYYPTIDLNNWGQQNTCSYIHT